MSTDSAMVSFIYVLVLFKAQLGEPFLEMLIFFFAVFFFFFFSFC